ncbi:MAG TPA: helix-turn-helix transcriptional regulator [Candidatus Merdisoma merdipullorum]|nr:helix-turn-helix transcriptional regulator [Candidatus Merdisoma merdipullorum]
MYKENYCIQRIKELMTKNGFTSYQLAKKSGVSLSTLLSMFQKNTEPQIKTLEKICSACDISVAQFFERDSKELTKDQEEILSIFNSLSPKHKEMARSYLRFLEENE